MVYLRQSAGDTTGYGPSHVDLMSNIGHKGNQPVFHKYRGEELNIKEMLASRVGIITDNNISFFNGLDPAEDDILRIVGLVREHGGVDYAKEQALRFAEGAEEALAGLPAGAAVDALRDSITYVVDRNR